MALVKNMARCPFCLEPILEGAKRCKHCQADLTEGSSGKKVWFGRIDNFRAGFIAGVGFAIVIVALIYAHIYWG